MRAWAHGKQDEVARQAERGDRSAAAVHGLFRCRCLHVCFPPWRSAEYWLVQPRALERTQASMRFRGRVYDLARESLCRRRAFTIAFAAGDIVCRAFRWPVCISGRMSVCTRLMELTSFLLSLSSLAQNPLFRRSRPFTPTRGLHQHIHESSL